MMQTIQDWLYTNDLLEVQNITLIYKRQKLLLGISHKKVTL